MTQYTSEVEYIRQKEIAERWGNKVLHLLGQHGYVEVAHNSGLITRKYHRDFGEFKAGDFIEVQPALPLTQLILQAPA